jgi:hypothetical protein
MSCLLIDRSVEAAGSLAGCEHASSKDYGGTEAISQRPPLTCLVLLGPEEVGVEVAVELGG